MSIIYLYFSLFMLFDKFTQNNNMKTILFVGLCMIFQYGIYLFNFTENYPPPFNTPTYETPYFNWLKYVSSSTFTADWQKYFIIFLNDENL